MMSLWDALRMNMMISYQELVRTFPKKVRRSGSGPAGRLGDSLQQLPAQNAVKIAGCRRLRNYSWL